MAKLAGRRTVRSLAAISGVFAASGLALLFVPVEYRSEARLTLHPPHLDHRLPLESRIGPLRQSVLARQTVVLMIQSSSLYMKERERMHVEDVVPLMRASMNLALRTVNGRTQLVVTYSAADPDAANRGCREIVDRILAEDSRLIDSTAQSALLFAEQQLARAEKNLANDPASRAYRDLAARRVAEARWEGRGSSQSVPPP